MAIIKDLAWSRDISLLEFEELFFCIFLVQSQCKLTDHDILKLTIYFKNNPSDF